MNVRKRLLLVATALAVGGSAAVAGAGTAVAATGTQPGPLETTAPKCMHDKEDKGTIYTTVWVTNTCKRNYRIKLIMARGADSRCFSIAPGQTRSSTSRGASPYLDRIVLC